MVQACLCHRSFSLLCQQQQFLRITESLSEPPSARASGTLIASPSNAKELLFFGGESYRDTIATFFNDLFVYSIEKDEWYVFSERCLPF